MTGTRERADKILEWLDKEHGVVYVDGLRERVEAALLAEREAGIEEASGLIDDALVAWVHPEWRKAGAALASAIRALIVTQGERS